MLLAMATAANARRVLVYKCHNVALRTRMFDGDPGDPFIVVRVVQESETKGECIRCR